MFKHLRALAFLLLFTCAAWSQAIVPQVQQTAQRLDAATLCGNGSSYNTVSNQSTLTIPAVSGQYSYITYLYLAANQDATSVANTNLNFTSTNLSGLEWGYSLAATVNLGLVLVPGTLTMPIKSAAPGTATTIVSPASQTHTGFAISACWYYSP